MKYIKEYKDIDWDFDEVYQINLKDMKTFMIS
jgi:hypothetical protein